MLGPAFGPVLFIQISGKHIISGKTGMMCFPEFDRAKAFPLGKVARRQPGRMRGHTGSIV